MKLSNDSVDACVELVYTTDYKLVLLTELSADVKTRQIDVIMNKGCGSALLYITTLQYNLLMIEI